MLSALTATTGAVDAVNFIGLGRAFAALATGNVLLLGLGLRAPGLERARRTATIVGLFTGGLLGGSSSGSAQGPRSCASRDSRAW